MIKLWRWRPLNVCSTLSGDLLVNLIRYNKKNSQIVRYFDSNEKQFKKCNLMTIANIYLQLLILVPYVKIGFDFGHLCYSYRSSAIMMVTCNHAGKPGFKYNGPVFDSTFKKSFDLVCITSDSRSQTLIADFDSHRVHIVN